jgi:hypothetical protein
LSKWSSFDVGVPKEVHLLLASISLFVPFHHSPLGIPQFEGLLVGAVLHHPESRLNFPFDLGLYVPEIPTYRNGVAVVVSMVVGEHTHLQEMHQSGGVVASYCFRYEAVAFAPLK